jgi:rubrerythrin
MKKNIIISPVIAIAIVLFFASCGGNKKDDKNNSSDSTKTSKVVEDLNAGLKGETTASAKYEAYSKKAKEEGFAQIATLFAATSKAEAIHAENHKKVLEKMGEKPGEIKPDSFTVKTTKENLEDALKGESYEVATMYPSFLKDADAEQAKDATKSFTWAMETEKKHKEFYQKALDALSTKKLKSLPAEYYVCPKCGNTYASGDVEEICGLCGTGKDKFILVK